MNYHMRMIYTSDKELKCVFSSLVIRVEALRAKYKGGVAAFAEKHCAVCNRNIVAYSAMSDMYLEKPIRDLLESGLSPKDDFVNVDAGPLVMFSSQYQGQEIDLGADWLKGYMQGSGVFVSFKIPK